MAKPGGGAGDSWEYSLRKYLLLLASLVATVTYGAAFNPPGGVWQNTVDDKHIAGDPVIRNTSYARYLVFFYGNATAFASSLVVIVLILILSILHDRGGISLTPVLAILRFVMVLDLISLMVAYAAGTFRDVLTAVYALLLLAGVVVYLAVHLALAWRQKRKKQQGGSLTTAPPAGTDDGDLRLRKVLMLLATFAASVTYLAGLSAPGGFWGDDMVGHKPGPGVAILKGGPHDARLKAFFVCNTTAFVASLLILVILLGKKLCFSGKVAPWELYGFIAAALLGLVAAYAAGSNREIDTTVYVMSLVGAVLLCIFIQLVMIAFYHDVAAIREENRLLRLLNDISDSVSTFLHGIKQSCLGQETSSSTSSSGDEHQRNEALEKARSLVLLLSTLAAAITYQAGLNPPGGLWQEDDDVHGRYKAGDPILLTTNPRRYDAFFYCNSIAFVASLVSIILARMKTLHHHNALEAAMVLDLFGLIGAYAAGSCRDVSTSIYAVALAGAVLVYVVIHVVFFTMDGTGTGDDGAHELVEKRRKRLLLFAILAATITYQAGLTPPGGFLDADDPVTGHHAGDPVLLNNYPRRYEAFFYCNSVSFMLSIALIILLVNPNLYRPAIRSNALSVCTAAGMMGIDGAYAAGCTQHLRTSIYIFVLAAVVLGSVVLLVAVIFVIHRKKKKEQNLKSGNSRNTAAAEQETVENGPGAEQNTAPVAGAGDVGRRGEEKRWHAKRKYLMLLGILAASVTYQAGLAPPGGSWQSNSNDGKYIAGDPVMHDNRTPRYRIFFYSNSTSFVASVVVIVLLLPEWREQKWWLRVMNTTVVLDLLGLLIAYAAGSSRSWETSVIVSVLVIAVLAYFAIHVLLSSISRRRADSAAESNGEANGGHQARMAPSLELSEAI